MVPCGSYQWHTSPLTWFKSDRSPWTKFIPSSGHQPVNNLFGGWWLNQHIWKILYSQNGMISPNMGENKKYIWNHHLVLVERFLFFHYPQKKVTNNSTQNGQNANFTLHGISITYPFYQGRPLFRSMRFAELPVWLDMFSRFPGGCKSWLAKVSWFLNVMGSHYPKLIYEDIKWTHPTKRC